MEDGAATTDSSINKTCMATFVASCTTEVCSLVDCCLMDHLWGCNFSTRTLCYYYSNLKLFSSLRLRWTGEEWLNWKETGHHSWAGCFVCNLKYLFPSFWLWVPPNLLCFQLGFLFSFYFLQHITSRRNRIAQSNRTKRKASCLSHLGRRGGLIFLETFDLDEA